MQSIRIRRFSLLSIFCGACFTLPLSACNDEHTGLDDEPPIEDGENDQSQPHEEITLKPLSADDPRPRIPCEGDLCYDPNDPVTKAAYNEFYDRMVGARGNPGGPRFFSRASANHQRRLRGVQLL